MLNLLSVAIFFCLLNSNTRADKDEIITEEDLKAFEEALADIRGHSLDRVDPDRSNVTPTEINRRLSGRTKKLNSKALKQSSSSFPRKRARQRSHLRRRQVFNFRKRKRKQPAANGIVVKKRLVGLARRKNATEGGSNRLLFKGEDRFSQERDIEKAVLHSLKESSTSSSSTTTTTETPSTSLNMLKITPPKHRGDRRPATTRNPPDTSSFSESTSTVAALEALIAALENIEPREVDGNLFIEDTTPVSSSSSTTTTTQHPTTTTTVSTTTVTTTEAPTTTLRRSRPRGSSFRITSTVAPPRPGPTPPPSFAEEAHKLSLEIENNFVETQEGPEPPSPPGTRGPQPPGFAPGFAPPGAEPPSDFVVNELNEADDFLAVANKLQILRKKSMSLPAEARRKQKRKPGVIAVSQQMTPVAGSGQEDTKRTAAEQLGLMDDRLADVSQVKVAGDQAEKLKRTKEIKMNDALERITRLRFQANAYSNIVGTLKENYRNAVATLDLIIFIEGKQTEKGEKAEETQLLLESFKQKVANLGRRYEERVKELRDFWQQIRRVEAQYHREAAPAA